MAALQTYVLNNLNDYFVKHSKILAIFGTVTATYWSLKSIYSAWCGIKVYFISRTCNLGTDVSKLGEWAAVTGSTDGIGKAFALELAKKGMSIILISRTPEKLENVAKEIATKYNVETKIIAVDFTKGPEIFQKIENDLQNLDIGVLVNNVGMVEGLPNFYTDVDRKAIENIVNVNVNAATMMSHIVLPRMVTKNKGAILNISSGLSMFPAPLYTMYSATKAYINMFGQGLQAEYRSKGIIVQTFVTHHVATKMSKTKVSLFSPDSGTYVRAALSTVGVQEVTTGYWPHTIQSLVVSLMPRTMLEKVFMSMAKANRAIQEKTK